MPEADTARWTTLWVSWYRPVNPSRDWYPGNWSWRGKPYRPEGSSLMTLAKGPYADMRQGRFHSLYYVRTERRLLWVYLCSGAMDGLWCIPIPEKPVCYWKRKQLLLYAGIRLPFSYCIRPDVQHRKDALVLILVHSILVLGLPVETEWFLRMNMRFVRLWRNVPC